MPADAADPPTVDPRRSTGGGRGGGPTQGLRPPEWTHGADSDDDADATRSLEREDPEREGTWVAIDDADVLRFATRAAVNTWLRAQRVDFNNWLLAREQRRSSTRRRGWPDAGAQRVALDPTSACNLLAYVRDPDNRNAHSRLRLREARCGGHRAGRLRKLPRHARG